MKRLDSWKDIPLMADDRAEYEFWQGHEISPRLLDQALHNPVIKESAVITMRVDPRMLSRIKRVARSRYLSYQSMMKQWIAERLDKEALEDNSGHPENGRPPTDV